MIKRTSLVWKRPELTTVEFRKLWLGEHVEYGVSCRGSGNTPLTFPWMEQKLRQQELLHYASIPRARSMRPSCERTYFGPASNSRTGCSLPFLVRVVGVGAPHRGIDKVAFISKLRS
jgi:hypothetical protein